MASIYHILQRYDEADAEYAQAVQMLDTLARDVSSEPAYRRDLAAVRNNRGMLLAGSRTTR